MERFVVISGCSGGGKSSIIEALESLGHPVVPEPGRRIVAEELERGGHAVPWVDLQAFARRAADISLADLEAARRHEGLVFFDRGLVDAAAALAAAGDRTRFRDLQLRNRYHPTVFLTPPWPELYRTDRERRHDFNTAVAEYDYLVAAYPSLGYRPYVLPKVSVEQRVELIQRELSPPEG